MELPRSQVHEFQHFNVTVSNKRQSPMHTEQSFTFEIEFHRFVLVNREAELILRAVDQALGRRCDGFSVDPPCIKVDLGINRILEVQPGELLRLRQLLSKVKFVYAN